MILIPIPWNNQSHKFSSEVQGFHPKGYFQASNLYDIFAEKQEQNFKFSFCAFYRTTENELCHGFFVTVVKIIIP